MNSRRTSNPAAALAIALAAPEPPIALGTAAASTVGEARGGNAAGVGLVGARRLDPIAGTQAFRGGDLTVIDGRPLCDSERGKLIGLSVPRCDSGLRRRFCMSLSARSPCTEIAVATDRGEVTPTRPAGEPAEPTAECCAAADVARGSLGDTAVTAGAIVGENVVRTECVRGRDRARWFSVGAMKWLLRRLEARELVGVSLAATGFGATCVALRSNISDLWARTRVGHNRQV